MIAASKVKNCKECGEEFKPSKSVQQFCGHECYWKNMTENEQFHICEVCKVEFKRRGNSPKKYCSQKCFGIAKNNQEERTCKSCGTKFLYKPSQSNHYAGAGKYCSRECAYKGTVRKTAKKPINDPYGRSKRKADKDWQLAVRLKDNYTCRKCGVYDEYIHTHHLATRGSTPALKHDVDNGICLCGSCHAWVHNNIAEAYDLGLIKNRSIEYKRLLERDKKGFRNG